MNKYITEFLVLAVFVGAFSVGSISGGAFNPAAADKA